METVIRRRALARGYWFARGLLDPILLFRMRHEIETIIQRRGWLGSLRGFAYDSQEFIDLQGEVQVLPDFAAIRSYPKLQTALANLLGAPPIGQCGDVCRVMFPHAPEFSTPAHQDQFFLKRESEVWSAWIPLADCSKEQGSLAVVARSNSLGLVGHDQHGRAVLPASTRWRTFDFKAGDVLFVHALTVHRGLDNCGTAPRISVDYRFSREAL